MEDLPRERQVLAEAGRHAMLSGVDEELVIHFLRSQISAGKVVQTEGSPDGARIQKRYLHRPGSPVDP